MKDILRWMAINVNDAIPCENIPGGCNQGDTAGAVRDNILGIVFWGLGVVGVIILIYGGIQFMMSQGDAGKAQKARMTILYAVVGIIVVIAASAITNFILEAVG